MLSRLVVAVTFGVSVTTGRMRQTLLHYDEPVYIARRAELRHGQGDMFRCRTKSQCVVLRKPALSGAVFGNLPDKCLPPQLVSDIGDKCRLGANSKF